MARLLLMLTVWQLQLLVTGILCALALVVAGLAWWRAGGNQIARIAARFRARIDEVEEAAAQAQSIATEARQWVDSIAESVSQRHTEASRLHKRATTKLSRAEQLEAQSNEPAPAEESPSPPMTNREWLEQRYSMSNRR